MIVETTTSVHPIINVGLALETGDWFGAWLLSDDSPVIIRVTNGPCEAQDALIKQILSAPAGEVLCLLNCIMPDEWREDDERADYDIKQARNFMIELIGGEEAEQLRDQFA